MNARPDSRLSTVAQGILAYLLRNPSAEDSVRGITEWWLLEQTVVWADDQVRHALSVLTEQGFLLERSGPDGGKRFRLNDARRSEAEGIIEHSVGGQEEEAA